MRSLSAIAIVLPLVFLGASPDIQAAKLEEGAEVEDSASVAVGDEDAEDEGESSDGGSSESSSAGTSESSSSGTSVSSSSVSSSSGGLGELSNKKLRVHLHSDFLNTTIHTGSTPTVIGFGVGRPIATDNALFGGFAGPSVLSLGFGAVILNGHAVVGGQAAISIDVVTGSGGVVIGGRLVPYFNYMFNTYGRIKPFVGGRVGIGGFGVIGDGVIFPIIGAQGGIHVFLAEPVSLDVALAVDYSPLIGIGSAGAGLAYHSINIAVPRLGLSTWF